jgi:hypothetical protein
MSDQGHRVNSDGAASTQSRAGRNSRGRTRGGATAAMKERKQCTVVVT